MFTAKYYNEADGGGPRGGAHADDDGTRPSCERTRSTEAAHAEAPAREPGREPGRCRRAAGRQPPASKYASQPANGEG